ncbi:MAG: DUF748 domain-containing protein [Gammaproteobacteria bacterium]
MQNKSTIIITLSKAAAILSVLVCVYALAGFLALPFFLKTKLPEVIQENTGRQSSVADVGLDPFDMSLRVHGFELLDADGKTFVAFDLLYIDFELASVFKKAYAFESMRLSGPKVNLVAAKDGRFNFSDLAEGKESDKKEAAGGMVPFAVKKMQVEKGCLTFKDLFRKTPFSSGVEDINFVVENFSTSPEAETRQRFQAVLESGGKIRWEGDFKLTPLSSMGKLELTGVIASPLLSFFKDRYPFEVTNGGFDLTLDYRFAFDNGASDLAIGRGKYRLRDFRLAEKRQDGSELSISSVSADGINFDLKRQDIRIDAFTLAGVNVDHQNKNWIKTPSLSIREIGVNLNKRKAAVARIASEGAAIEGWLGGDGRLNFEELFSSAKQPQVEPVAPEDAGVEKKSAAWTAGIGEIDIKNYAVRFEDRRQRTPVVAELSPFNLNLKGVSTSPDAVLAIDLDSGFNNTGRIGIGGVTRLEPLSTELDLQIEQIALTAVQPYLDSATRLRLADGRFNTKGKLVYRKTNEKQDLSYAGDVVIDNFASTDKIHGKDFVKWEKLSAAKLNFNLDPLRLRIEEVEASRPYARVIINSDKTTNISRVLSAADAPPADTGKSEAPAADKKPGMDVEIGKVRLVDGSAYFADATVKPQFRRNITQLGGQISGLSSDPDSFARVAMDGKIEKAPVTIYGKVNPFNTEMDMIMKFDNIDLKAFSPYSGKFAGYKIEKGKLSLDLNYRIVDKKLQAENNVILNQFTLGEKVDSPDAVSLPLSLAVALLKDRNGVINLDLPLIGDLEDPQFQIRSIIGKALLNLITKVVSSPFTLLGRLVGGGESMNVIEFGAGDSVLDQAAGQKLAQIAVALQKRPNLNLEITGKATRQQDWPVFAEELLTDRLKTMKTEQFWTFESDPEKIVLNEETYNSLLRKAYLKDFENGRGGADVFGKDELESTENLAKAKQQLLERIEPDEDRLRQLAGQRAAAIRDYLVEYGGLPLKRIYIVSEKLEESSEGAAVPVELSLKTK